MLRANARFSTSGLQFHRLRNATPAGSDPQIELQLLIRCTQNVINVGPEADSRKCGIFVIGPISRQNPPRQTRGRTAGGCATLFGLFRVQRLSSRRRGPWSRSSSRAGKASRRVIWLCEGGFSRRHLAFRKRRSTGRFLNGCWRRKGEDESSKASVQRQNLMATRPRRS